MPPIPTTIALIIFASVILIIYFLTRKGVWTLEKMQYLPGEKVLFTDDAKKFEEMFRGDNMVDAYQRAHVVVTNKRIILTQKTLFGNSHAIRAAINYVDKGLELTVTDLMGGFLSKMRKTGKNFLELFTTKEKISLKHESNSPIVEILVPFKDHGIFFREELKFLIYTNHCEKYGTLLRTP